MADAAALRVLETRTYDSLASDFKEEFCILERQLYAKPDRPAIRCRIPTIQISKSYGVLRQKKPTY